VGQTKGAQQARKLARQRRAQLDADRGQRDQRIEQAITDTILALQSRDAAAAAHHDAELAAGTAMRRLGMENLRTDEVAALCDVSEALVKRLTVMAARGKAEHPAKDDAEPDATPASTAPDACLGGADETGEQVDAAAAATGGR
jgi:hypothetical protein